MSQMETIKNEICQIIARTLNKVVIKWDKITISCCSGTHIIIILDDVIYCSNNLKHVEELFYLIIAYYIINHLQGVAIPTDKNCQYNMIKEIFGSTILVEKNRGPRYITFTASSYLIPVVTIFYANENRVSTNLKLSNIIDAVVNSKSITETTNSVFPTIQYI